MKKYITLFFFFLIFNCYAQVVSNDIQVRIYEAENSNNVLFIFPGFGESIEHIEQHLNIHGKAIANHISIVYIGFNRRLFLEEEEKRALGKRISSLIQDKFTDHKAFIGGFSSGGNVALIVSDYLQRANMVSIEGCFIVDAPLDLKNLYKVNETKIRQNFSKVAVNEARYINSILSQITINNYNYFNQNNKESKLSKSLISNTKFLLISEYAPLWWKENRGVVLEETNFHTLTLFDEYLRTQKAKVDFQKTIDKGFRKNGARHPHSWSILDHNYLINWVLEDKID
ncbi:hypothetical protein [Flammeovirga sp. SJP92]|uniref:hypothetical protein n=1 Tax=Flammeovirga sp. SJP92 TaxID=1775430 RepID=UPI000788B5E3|nr:hypothetical protein [Flammeovirga sp. SJP92]KXX68634.1 hypothetical protein AVL50_23025 [Flammeovirga sp. SJP92]